MSTRRQWRQARPKLQSGQKELKGTVIKFLPEKNLGYIAPVGGAARIVFYFVDVPSDRSKCVGVGRTVYFDVVEKGDVRRSGHSRPQLVAVIRSSRKV